MAKEEFLGTINMQKIIKKQGDNSKKKLIALTITNTTSNDGETDDNENDKEITLMAKKFKRFMKFNKELKRKDELKDTSKSKKEKNDVIACFKCHKP